MRRSIVYIIKNGDTLPGIAGKYGITVNLLCELNNINPGDYIYPGNKLFIPLE
ncbi:MAG: LysM peptidoglycan-binding domain-containing protein [Lachnospiraceae bacterium]|nr:LysM peptidoglycan-binding domain-containing protein [Candidatus Colinaster equi]